MEDEIRIRVNDVQKKTLERRSGYFKSMFRFNQTVHSSPSDFLMVKLPNARSSGKGAYFSLDEMQCAIAFLASSTNTIPYNITPIALYHLGLFLDAEILVILALITLTHCRASTFIFNLLDIYPLGSITQQEHSHVTYCIQLITHYTGFSRQTILDMVSKTSRKEKKNVHCVMQFVSPYESMLLGTTSPPGFVYYVELLNLMLSLHVVIGLFITFVSLHVCEHAEGVTVPRVTTITPSKILSTSFYSKCR